MQLEKLEMMYAFSELMDIRRVVFWEYSPKDVSLRFHSGPFAEHLINELVGQEMHPRDAVSAVFHPEDYGPILHAITNLSLHKGAVHLPCRMRHQDHESWIGATLSAMVVSEDGTVLGSINAVEAPQPSRQTTNSAVLNRVMLEHAPTVCMIFDESGDPIECNQSACTLFSLPDKQSFLQSFYRLSPEYQLDGSRSEASARQRVQHAARHGQITFEWLHQDLQGRPIDTKVTLVPVMLDGKRCVAAYVEDFRPTNAMLRAIAELRSEVDIGRDVMLNAVPLACDMWDEDMNMVYCNQACYELFDLSSVEEYCDKFYLLNAPIQENGRESGEYANELVEKAKEYGEVTFPWLHRKLNGDLIPAKVTLKQVAYGAGHRIVGHIYDLRAEIEANEKAAEANQRSQIMTDMNPVATTFWDSKNTLIDCNQSALHMFGVSSVQELKERFHMLSPEFQPDGNRSNVSFYLQMQRAFELGQLELDWVHKNTRGDTLQTEVILFRVELSKEQCVVAYIRDVTAEKNMLSVMQKAKEAAEAGDRAKSNFLANISHEIRTPMNAIIGMSELLLYEPLSDKQRRYVDDINVSSKSLLGIINDILDFSKIESGKLELVESDYHFRSLIDNIASSMKFIAHKKNLDFIMKIDEGLPPCLYGDEIKLRQVLTNLLSNAIKFTKEGHVSLSVSGIGLEGRNPKLSFQIADTGIGILEKDFAKLFNPFEQLDKVENKNIEGTGLGLVITQKIVEMMKGTIQISSTYGEGSCFTVTLPMVISNRAPVEMEDNTFNFLKATQANVLVVDDVEANLRVVSAMLEMSDIICDTAQSGEEAIRMVQEKDYDVVFMDHMMPKMDGAEATLHIRALGGKFLSLVIVALTANVATGVKEKMISYGMNDYLSKPIDKALLNHILYKYLPQEKIVEYANKPEMAERLELSAPLQKVRLLPGMDLDSALSRLENRQDIYESTLLFFIKQSPALKRKLLGILSERDVKSFAIEIHGAKGYLSTLGAMALSEKAKEMEFAAKDGNMDFCVQRFDAFYQGYEDFELALIKIFTPDQEQVKGEASVPHLLEDLKTVRAELEDFRLDVPEEIVSKYVATAFGPEIDHCLVTLLEKIIQMDYFGAVETIDELFQIIENLV